MMSRSWMLPKTSSVPLQVQDLLQVYHRTWQDQTLNRWQRTGVKVGIPLESKQHLWNSYWWLLKWEWWTFRLLLVRVLSIFLGQQVLTQQVLMQVQQVQLLHLVMEQAEQQKQPHMKVAKQQTTQWMEKLLFVIVVLKTFGVTFGNSHMV